MREGRELEEVYCLVLLCGRVELRLREPREACSAAARPVSKPEAPQLPSPWYWRLLSHAPMKRPLAGDTMTDCTSPMPALVVKLKLKNSKERRQAKHAADAGPDS